MNKGVKRVLNRYEKLLMKYDNQNIKETNDLPDFQPGYCFNGTIYIKKGLSPKRKCEILAEEIAHVKLTHGNILDQTILLNRRFEGYARREAMRMLIPINELQSLYYMSIHELSDHFEVTEEFVNDTIELYKKTGKLCRIFA